MSSNLSDRELTEVGFGGIGSDVRIDRRVAIFNPSMITLGSHVRIDAFTVVAGGAAALRIGSFVHISAGCYLSPGDGGIVIDDFCTLAPRVALHGHSDDYVAGALTGGIVPEDLTGGVGQRITLGAHVIIGSGTVVLPGVAIGAGASIGALSLVRESIDAGVVVAGNPLRHIRTRDTSRLQSLGAEAWRRSSGSTPRSSQREPASEPT